MRFAGLILAATLPAALAQDAGTVEGRVASSVDHVGISGAIVAVESQRVTTDSSGTFRLTGLAPGEHTLWFEAEGFFKSETKFRLNSTVAVARLDAELIAHSTISGGVFDDEGRPAGGVQVEITEAVRGTGTTWRTFGGVTDGEGHYHVDTLKPGTYLAMARLNPRRAGRASQERRALVDTYSPAVTDRNQATRLVLRGGTQLVADIHLLAVPVHAIRGMIYDDGGERVSTKVTLASSEVLERAEVQVQSRDGAFEFPDVASGEWRLIAEAERGGRKLRGTGVVLLSHHDVENVTLRLSPPFALQAFVEPRGLGESTTIELYPTDAPPTGAAFSRRDADGALRFPSVYPGRYRVEVFAKTPDHYLASILVGEQDVLGQEVGFSEGMPPLHVVFKADAGGLRGAVENCNGGSVLLLPWEEGLWNFRFVRVSQCDPSGHFEIGGLRPGNYYAVAFDHVDETGLDDLGTLRRLANISVKAQVDRGRVSYMELRISTWPE